ncbi:signal recognition particle 9 kDa protein [Macrobrachium rosenbergii]|uniref:signal recognition particle 9 kDa protein-like n=1 Tax=Macrobrachium nipponense TaxID=159736 RepID=UPI0030C89515
MVYVELLDDFEKMAERIYLNSPMKTRCTMKYDHSNTCLKVKVTDDRACVQYKTDSQQELRKLEKLISNMMKHMASGER